MLQAWLQVRAVCSSPSKLFANFIFQRALSTKVETINESDGSETNHIKSFDSIPGPKPAPIFGYLWHILPIVGKYHGKQLHNVHIRYQKEYGNIVRLRDLKISEDLVLLYDPKDFETIFRNEGPWPKRNLLPSIKYYRDVVRKDIFQGYGGTFTSDGEDWVHARSIMNALIMQPRVVKHYMNSFSKVADDFVDRIKYLAAQNDAYEMPEEFLTEIMKWSLESTGVLSLDTRFNLLGNDPLDPEKLQYIQNARQFLNLIYEIDVLPSVAKYVSTPKWKKYIKTMDEIINFIQKQINQTKERIEREGCLQKPENDMSVIEKLIKNYENKYVFGNVLDILIAGVDTTSRSMAAALYLLAANPDKQEILRKEVNEIFPGRDDILTVEKIEKMPYLRAVIKESQRLNPISIIIPRVTTTDLTLSGYHVPKGSHVLMEQLPLYWSDEHFPEAKKFIPERWLRKDNKLQEVNPWVLLPFGFGPRSCVGRRIANSELEILLVKIIKNFIMEWHYGEPTYEVKLVFGITSPLKIRMVPIET